MSETQPTGTSYNTASDYSRSVRCRRSCCFALGWGMLWGPRLAWFGLKYGSVNLNQCNKRVLFPSKEEECAHDLLEGVFIVLSLDQESLNLALGTVHHKEALSS